MVVPFTPGPAQHVTGPISAATLQHQLWDNPDRPRAPTAVRIDGHFEMVRVRSVPKQIPPYPLLAEAIDHEHRRELHDISGTMVGFCFPDGLSGIEIVGFHLHFACDRRLRGGHVLDYTLRDATVRIDEATELHVELPADIDPPDRRQIVDQSALRRLESS